MKFFLSILFFGLIVFLGIQLYNLYSQKTALAGRVAKVTAQAEALVSENEKLNFDLEYFSNFENLIKEYKALFNYKNPGERLFIIVPQENQW